MSEKIDSLLDLFLEDSYREFHLREAARLAKMNPMTASKYLNRLVKDGIVKRRAEKNYILFSADTESRPFTEKKRYHNVRKLESSGLVEFLEKEFNYPEAIMLFGSFSKAENRKGSDIDLFVLTESKNEPDLSSFEKKLGAAIQIFRHDRREFELMKNGNKELLNNIMNGVILSGFLEVFK